MTKVRGDIAADFKWLVQLLCTTQVEAIPRILIFFHNLNKLSDAFEYTRARANLQVGEKNPIIAMFHKLTNSECKDAVINSLAENIGRLRVVFCSSSLSMGMNLKNIQYVIHYGPPVTAEAFVQETGRAAREKSLHGHSILMTYPRMFAGRKPDDTMKAYVKQQQCLRNILLAKFSSAKPEDQLECCDFCEAYLDCPILSLIRGNDDSSATESMSDSDSSVASAGALDDLPDL